MKPVIAFLCTVILLCAQTRSDKVAGLERMLASAAEPGAVMLAIAGEYAAAGEKTQALGWLRRAAQLNPEYNPASDREFAPMAGMPDFDALVERARKANPPVRKSRVAATIGEDDLIPEGITYHPKSGKLYVSSINKHKIVEISRNGEARDFVREKQDGLGQVLGMKVDARTNTLWANCMGREGSGVYHFDLATGRLIKKHVIAADLLFNDLAVNSKGDVFITATRAGTLYWISSRTGTLEEWHPELKVSQANGIALSGDEKLLFVSTFPDGITAIDLESGRARPLKRPAAVSLAGIDGLSFYRNTLIAVQNGGVSHRIARFFLTPALDGVERVEVLERGNPLFDLPTTGTVAGGEFYYIANSQLFNFDGRGIIVREKLRPISILKVRL